MHWTTKHRPSAAPSQHWDTCPRQSEDKVLSFTVANEDRPLDAVFSSGRQLDGKFCVFRLERVIDEVTNGRPSSTSTKKSKKKRVAFLAIIKAPNSTQSTPHTAAQLTPDEIRNESAAAGHVFREFLQKPPWVSCDPWVRNRVKIRAFLSGVGGDVRWGWSGRWGYWHVCGCEGEGGMRYIFK